MAERYHPLNNNCQIFCLKLVQSIRVPNTPKDVFCKDLEVPRALQEQVYFQRLVDFVTTRLRELYPEDFGELPDAGYSVILPVEAFYTASLTIATAYLLYRVHDKVEFKIYVLLVLVLLGHRFYGNLGIFVLRQGMGKRHKRRINVEDDDGTIQKVYNSIYL